MRTPLDAGTTEAYIRRVSKPTGGMIRLDVECARLGLSRKTLIDAPGLPDLGLTPENIDDLLCPCQRGVSYHDHVFPQTIRMQILRRLAVHFGMKESEALLLLSKVRGATSAGKTA